MKRTTLIEIKTPDLEDFDEVPCRFGTSLVSSPMMKALSLRFTALSVVILTFCAAVPAEAGDLLASQKPTAKATVFPTATRS